MDTIIVFIVGLVAVGYIAKIIWQELQGKTQCHCSGSCGSNCHKQVK
ncbi:FeoB-associated Cys-rich membrane protein [Sporomusa sp. KB1]|jgi:hypothetical protein|nr:FeoB-associated Cys-rich membrane protein [Sporomusa sp. KB1]TWH46167.1 attachment p12 family protein [Sporomusa sp. KB1]